PPLGTSLLVLAIAARRRPPERGRPRVAREAVPEMGDRPAAPGPSRRDRPPPPLSRRGALPPQRQLPACHRLLPQVPRGPGRRALSNPGRPPTPSARAAPRQPVAPPRG